MCIGALDIFVHSEAVEVRLPDWKKTGGEEVDEDAQVAADSAEFEGGAVPYNKDRDKTATSRYLLSELPELRDSKQAIIERVSEAARKLFNHSEKGDACKRDNEQDQGKHNMAVVGVDLLVEADTGIVFILEFNNNPAMPQRGKHRMSEAYKQSLVQLSSDLMALGLRGGRGESDEPTEQERFTRVE